MARRTTGRAQFILAIVLAAAVGVIGLALRDGSGGVTTAPSTASALAVEVTGVPEYIYVGTRVNLSLEYTNYAAAASGPVMLEADIPANFAVVDASHGGVVSNTKVQWPLEGIAGQSGGSVQLTLNALPPRDYSTAAFDVPDYTGHAVFDDGFKLWARITAGEGSTLLASAVAYTDTGSVIPPGPHLSISLYQDSQPISNALVGQELCVVANLYDQGDPAPSFTASVGPISGVTVDFVVTSETLEVESQDDVLTDANGDATFCYTSNEARVDDITATADYTGSPTDQVSVEWFEEGTMTLRGIVYYKNRDGIQLGLPGALVEACDSANECKRVTTSAASTVPPRSAGEYEIFGLHVGPYTIRVFPPNDTDPKLNEQTADAIVNPGVNTLDIRMPDPLPEPIPPGVDFGPFWTNSWVDTPIVYWLAELNISVEACPGAGDAYFEISVDNDSAPSFNGLLFETETGLYENLSPIILFPMHGFATVDITIECPDPLEAQLFTFNVYIDPSGIVEDTNGDPIEGATVTLYVYDEEEEEFVVVPNGSLIMSPENRSNPDTTDENGFFRWDVLEGLYKVRASAPNCFDPEDETVPYLPYVETAELPVPPIQTDLLLVLECVEPEVENGSLTLNKTVVPASDTGKFNLQVNGSNFGTGANVGNGGTSGKLGLEPGGYTVRETAGTSTSLADYMSSISCVRAGTDTVVAATNGVGPLNVDVPEGVDVVCNFTNVQIPPACRGMTFDKYILGTEGNDTINGSGLRELILGLGGNDTINGGAGNDCIVGGPGNDRLSGGAGNDRLLGEAGNDTLNGDSGVDAADGGPDRDACTAESRTACES